MAAELLEHWFNRRWRVGRRDVYLTRDDRGWHVRARRGGPDGVEVVHHFTDEPDAHAMLLRRASASQTSGTPITVRRAGGRDAGAF